MALGSLQTGKSPGSDGLPTEFYKAFWQDLGDVLVLVMNERFHIGILTNSQREGLLRLLYKMVSFAAVFRDVTQRSLERNGCSHSKHIPFLI